MSVSVRRSVGNDSLWCRGLSYRVVSFRMCRYYGATERQMVLSRLSEEAWNRAKRGLFWLIAAGRVCVLKFLSSHSWQWIFNFLSLTHIYSASIYLFIYHLSIYLSSYIYISQSFKTFLSNLTRICSRIASNIVQSVKYCFMVFYLMVWRILETWNVPILQFF